MVAPVPAGLPDLAILVAGEVAIGAVIGFLARLMLLAFEMAGEIVAIQMGFGIAAVFDPLGGHRSSLVGRWLWLAGTALFLTLGGHHLLLRAFGTSLTALPPGRGFPVDQAAEIVFRASADAIASPLRIAAPIVGALLLATLGLGILARTVPQMNVFVVGIPGEDRGRNPGPGLHASFVRGNRARRARSLGGASRGAPSGLRH